MSKVPQFDALNQVNDRWDKTALTFTYDRSTGDPKNGKLDSHFMGLKLSDGRILEVSNLSHHFDRNTSERQRARNQQSLAALLFYIQDQSNEDVRRIVEGHRIKLANDQEAGSTIKEHFKNGTALSKSFVQQLQQLAIKGAEEEQKRHNAELTAAYMGTEVVGNDAPDGQRAENTKSEFEEFVDGLAETRFVDGLAKTLTDRWPPEKYPQTWLFIKSQASKPDSYLYRQVKKGLETVEWKANIKNERLTKEDLKKAVTKTLLKEFRSLIDESNLAFCTSFFTREETLTGSGDERLACKQLAGAICTLHPDDFAGRDSNTISQQEIDKLAEAISNFDDSKKTLLEQFLEFFALSSNDENNYDEAVRSHLDQMIKKFVAEVNYFRDKVKESRAGRSFTATELRNLVRKKLHQEELNYSTLGKMLTPEIHSLLNVYRKHKPEYQDLNANEAQLQSGLKIYPQLEQIEKQTQRGTKKELGYGECPSVSGLVKGLIDDILADTDGVGDQVSTEIRERFNDLSVLDDYVEFIGQLPRFEQDGMRHYRQNEEMYIEQLAKGVQARLQGLSELVDYMSSEKDPTIDLVWKLENAGYEQAGERIIELSNALREVHETIEKAIKPYVNVQSLTVPVGVQSYLTQLPHIRQLSHILAEEQVGGGDIRNVLPYKVVIEFVKALEQAASDESKAISSLTEKWPKLLYRFGVYATAINECERLEAIKDKNSEDLDRLKTLQNRLEIWRPRLRKDIDAFVQQTSALKQLYDQGELFANKHSAPKYVEKSLGLLVSCGQLMKQRFENKQFVKTISDDGPFTIQQHENKAWNLQSRVNLVVDIAKNSLPNSKLNLSNVLKTVKQAKKFRSNLVNHMQKNPFPEVRDDQQSSLQKIKNWKLESLWSKETSLDSLESECQSMASSLQEISKAREELKQLRDHVREKKVQPMAKGYWSENDTAPRKLKSNEDTKKEYLMAIDRLEDDLDAIEQSIVSLVRDFSGYLSLSTDNEIDDHA